MHLNKRACITCSINELVILTSYISQDRVLLCTIISSGNAKEHFLCFGFFGEYEKRQEVLGCEECNRKVRQTFGVKGTEEFWGQGARTDAEKDNANVSLRMEES